MNISKVSPSAHYHSSDINPKENLPEEDKVKLEEQKTDIEKTPIEQQKDNENDPEYRRKIEELKAVEREVVAHEMAHKSVGGQYASSASFSYTMGPDGKRYKTGGEVSISVPTGGDLEKTEQALERVKRAALAPANPSGQDLRVAANASATQARIRSELTKQKAMEAYSKQNKKPEKNNKKGQLNIAI